MALALMIDPPSGWMYGFPKPDPGPVEDIEQWFLDQGYPQELIDQGMLKHCRYFETEVTID